MIKIATLFSGVGTPEQSLKHLHVEHETVFACEIDKYARTTYLANNQEPNTFYDDVYSIDGNKYKNQIDILIGGSPCQSFSIAGKRMGTSCPRGNLIYEYFRIVEESQPKVFIYENVKGFLSIDKGETFKNFVQSFKDLGYTVSHQVLNTKDYGVPQNRERIYIVGFKDKVEFEFAPKQELKLKLKDMLEDSVDKKYLLNHELVSIANGLIEVSDEVRVKEATKLGYKVAEEGDSINISVPSSKTRRGRVGKQVAQTLDTACNQVVFNNEYIFRKLTPRECFRLQGFDDSFIFPQKMSDSQLYKQAGNGMSRNILDMVFNQIYK